MAQIGGGFSMSDGRKASAAFSPTSLPGFIEAYKFTPGSSGLWQDSARTTAATVATDPVGCVDGLSGVAVQRIIQATSGNRPVLSANGLDFDGTNDNLLAASFGYASQTALTIVMRYTLNGAGSGAFAGFASLGNITDQTDGIALNQGNTGASAVNTLVGESNFVSSDLMTSTRAFGTYVVATLTIDGAGRALYVNGTAEGTAGAGASMSLAKLGIGGRIQAGVIMSYYSNISLSGLIVCGGILGSTDRANAEAWV